MSRVMSKKVTGGNDELKRKEKSTESTGLVNKVLDRAGKGDNVLACVLKSKKEGGRNLAKKHSNVVEETASGSVTMAESVLNSQPGKIHCVFEDKFDEASKKEVQVGKPYFHRRFLNMSRSRVSLKASLEAINSSSEIGKAKLLALKQKKETKRLRLLFSDSTDSRGPTDLHLQKVRASSDWPQLERHLEEFAKWTKETCEELRRFKRT